MEIEETMFRKIYAFGKKFFVALITESRIKSLAWRLGMMSLAFTIDYAIQAIAGLQLPAYVSISLGLLLGEASKAVHNVLDQARTAPGGPVSL